MTEEAVTTLVYPINVGAIWPHAVACLAPAIERSGTHNEEDVRKKLLTGNAHLWVQWKNKTVEAAAVTEFIDYPKGLFLRVWLMGGKENVKILWEKFEEMVLGFAYDNSCAGIEHISREYNEKSGWERRFPHIKMHREAGIYRFPLPERKKEGE